MTTHGITFQWNGTALMSVIEQGADWAHLTAFASGIATGVSIVAPLRTIVDEGRLDTYATSADETMLLQSYRISTLFDPIVHPDVDGYNSGNLVEGLDVSLIEMHMFVITNPNCSFTFL